MISEYKGLKNNYASWASSMKHAAHQFIMQGSVIDVPQLENVARLGVHNFYRLRLFFILGLATRSFPQSLDSNAQHREHGETAAH